MCGLAPVDRVRLCDCVLLLEVVCVCVTIPPNNEIEPALWHILLASGLAAALRYAPIVHYGVRVSRHRAGDGVHLLRHHAYHAGETVQNSLLYYG